MKNNLTAEQVRRLLDYNHETGLFRWKVRRSGNTKLGEFGGCPSGAGYPRISINQQNYVAHRLAWLHYYGEWPAMFLDHIDGDRANNRISNLREADYAQNAHNSRGNPTNSSGYKGVYRNRSGRWAASICVNYRQRHLGVFDTRELARDAYNAAALGEFGEFARAS